MWYDGSVVLKTWLDDQEDGCMHSFQSHISASSRVDDLTVSLQWVRWLKYSRDSLFLATYWQLKDALSHAESEPGKYI